MISDPIMRFESSLLWCFSVFYPFNSYRPSARHIYTVDTQITYRQDCCIASAIYRPCIGGLPHILSAISQGMERLFCGWQDKEARYAFIYE